MSDKNLRSTEDQIMELFQKLSPESQELVGEVLEMEQEHIHLKVPKGIREKIVKTVEGILR